ncbi:MAG: cbb3-type cytochrome c oxidase subunit 3 [Myxococcales bacterium]|nr:cbb3-type cytochrome c oxidase subunit 3 [Myxococcales bacterium]
MIGWLVKEFFGQSPMLALPKIALIIFLVVFVAITIRTLLMKRSDVERQARLPLEDDDGVIRRDSTREQRAGDGSAMAPPKEASHA